MELSGKTVIQDEVFTEITRNAMQKVNEVFQKDRKGTLAGLTQILSERIAPQVTVKKADKESPEAPFGSVAFDLKLTLVYGVNIPDVVRRVRETIVEEVETLTGYTVERIDVSVEKLVTPCKTESDIVQPT
jgi:uncharacterized alkaline shock family protein YloU